MSILGPTHLPPGGVPENTPTRTQTYADITLAPAAWRVAMAKTRLAPPLKGLDGLVDRGVGRISCNFPRTRSLLRCADAVLALEDVFAGMSNRDLTVEADRCALLFRRGRDTKADQVRAVALVREGAWRSLEMRPYRVQVAAAFGLMQGRLVEFATGEGKTLVAAVAAVLCAWRGRGCHVLTANDYLAKRDADVMRGLYDFFGLTAVSIQPEMSPEDRRDAYAADITYGTHKEIAADYLRDQLTVGPYTHLNQRLRTGLLAGQNRAPALVMRGLEYAIVDEADSILVDDAVTPLILAGEGPPGELHERCSQAVRMIRGLNEGEHYRVDYPHRDIDLTAAGRKQVAVRVGAATEDAYGKVWKSPRIREELVVQALTAKHLYLRDKQYIIEDGKIVIVDESTGRPMPDRTWQHGLHQAVEAKEGVEPSPSQITMTQVSFQRFFRMYNQLSGLTGTAWEQRYELRQVYRLQTVRVPTHKPCLRVQARPTVDHTESDCFERIVSEAEAAHATGQPVLIGTRDVRASEAISRLLAARELKHEVLNAIHHEQEAAVVAQAGGHGAVTVATNMAGRGTDIKLDADAKAAGGLYVMAVGFNRSPRIDRQLFGRAARQGDPGRAAVFTSRDDEMLRQHTRDPITRTALRIAWKLPLPWLKRRVYPFKLAQRRAAWVSYAQRRSVLMQDHWSEEYLGFAIPEH